MRYSPGKKSRNRIIFTCRPHQDTHSKYIIAAEEKAQRLRGLVILAGDLGLVLNSHGRSPSLTPVPDCPRVAHMQANIHTHFLKKSLSTSPIWKLDIWKAQESETFWHQRGPQIGHSIPRNSILHTKINIKILRHMSILSSVFNPAPNILLPTWKYSKINF